MRQGLTRSWTRLPSGKVVATLVTEALACTAATAPSHARKRKKSITLQVIDFLWETFDFIEYFNKISGE